MAFLLNLDMAEKYIISRFAALISRIKYLKIT